MDNQTLNSRLSVSLGFSREKVELFLDAFNKVMYESITGLSSVAVPSFGTFAAVKTDEEVKKDLSTGKKILFPPNISINFNPAASLRKKVTENDGK